MDSLTSPELLDIHLPESASFWPLAFGWWILLALTLLIVTWLAIKALNRAKQKKRQRKIFTTFKSLEKKLIENPSNATIAEINTLLRQVAINYYPRTEIASLTGSDWLEFLDQSGKTSGFSRGAGRILIEAPYRLDKKRLDKKQLDNENLDKEFLDKNLAENVNLNEFIPLIQRWSKKVVRGNTHD